MLTWRSLSLSLSFRQHKNKHLSSSLAYTRQGCCCCWEKCWREELRDTAVRTRTATTMRIGRYNSRQYSVFLCRQDFKFFLLLYTVCTAVNCLLLLFSSSSSFVVVFLTCFNSCWYGSCSDIGTMSVLYVSGKNGRKWRHYLLGGNSFSNWALSIRSCSTFVRGFFIVKNNDIKWS